MKKIISGIKYLLTLIAIILLAIAIWNLDLSIRMIYAIQQGTFSMTRLRFEIAAFNIGYESQVMPFDSKISVADDMLQLLVPDGEFMMGKEGEPDNDSPIHVVYLDSYWIDQVEVTNAMYETCVKK